MATATEVPGPTPPIPARPFARVVAWLPPFLLVVASVLARLPALVNARGVNSDAAVVGLQAMHILHGEWSWFLWGAGYQASLDAALVAAAFAITGPSALTLMVVPLIGYLVLVGLTYDVLRRAVGRGGAAVACLPLVFAPQPINGVALYAPRQWAITTTVLAVWLASRACGRRAPLWLAGSGFVAGFAVYLDLFTLQMMPAVGVFALWCAFAAPPGAESAAVGVSGARRRRARARPGRRRRRDRLVAGAAGGRRHQGRPDPRQGRRQLDTDGRPVPALPAGREGVRTGPDDAGLPPVARPVAAAGGPGSGGVPHSWRPSAGRLSRSSGGSGPSSSAGSARSA